MPICKNCREFFSSLTKIDGKRQDSRRRIYCLKCNPKGERRFWGGKLTNKSLGITDRNKIFTKHICKICGKEYSNRTRNLECFTCKSKKNRHKRKIKAISLFGRKCKICGYNFCEDAFVFHHVDPKLKSFILSANWGLAWESILLELKKCVLLCCRCHVEIHNGITKLPNGTTPGYNEKIN
jgi:hypothetical protein